LLARQARRQVVRKLFRASYFTTDVFGLRAATTEPVESFDESTVFVFDSAEHPIEKMSGLRTTEKLLEASEPLSTKCIRLTDATTVVRARDLMCNMVVVIDRDESGGLEMNLGSRRAAFVFHEARGVRVLNERGKRLLESTIRWTAKRRP